MGILLGIPNQIALATLATGLIAATVRGYQAWWKRRPTRSTGVRTRRRVPDDAQPLEAVAGGPLDDTTTGGRG